MNSFLVVEIRIWFLLLLLLLLIGLGVGAFFLARRWLRRRDAARAEAHRAESQREAMARRNSLLIRLDHELKNPLTALRTSAASVREMIRDENPNTEEIAPVVRQIDTSSRRVARLLADLRKLADVESRNIEFARVDIDRLIHQAVEDARTAPGAEDRMIVATVARAPWKLPDVAGEEDLLLSAILNLLGNAIKYSADTDVVELRANEQIIRNHRWVVIEVADTGSGIPADEQDAVWDELSRGKRVRSVAGSGMGLSLVRSIITRHGGSVELFSQEGVGTSVRLVLPVLGDAQAPVAPQGGDGTGAAAAARPVQPFHEQGRGATGPAFMPPREPSQAEIDGRILGSPRRSSRRRLQKVNGELRDSQTGEAFGDSGGFDSAPYQQFKPPQAQPGQAQAAGPPPQPAGQAQQGSGPVGQPASGPAPYGSAPGQYGSGPAQYGSAPGQYGSAPGPYGSAPAQYGSGPAQYGSGPSPYGSAPGQYGSAPNHAGAAPGPHGSGPSPYGAAPGQQPPIPPQQPASQTGPQPGQQWQPAPHEGQQQPGQPQPGQTPAQQPPVAQQPQAAPQPQSQPGEQPAAPPAPEPGEEPGRRSGGRH